MTKAMKTLLVAGAVALVAGPIAALADVEDEAKAVWDEVNEQWPEEVPTPWFCTGTEPVDVCVPPW